MGNQQDACRIATDAPVVVDAFYLLTPPGASDGGVEAKLVGIQWDPATSMPAGAPKPTYGGYGRAFQAARNLMSEGPPRPDGPQIKRW